MNVEIDYSQAAVIAGYHHTVGGQADVPFDQSGIQSRVGEMQNLVNPVADQIFRTGPEQSFARRIDPGYQMLRVDDDQGLVGTARIRLAEGSVIKPRLLARCVKSQL